MYCWISGGSEGGINSEKINAATKMGRTKSPSNHRIKKQRASVGPLLPASPNRYRSPHHFEHDLNLPKLTVCFYWTTPVVNGLGISFVLLDKWR